VNIGYDQQAMKPDSKKCNNRTLIERMPLYQTINLTIIRQLVRTNTAVTTLQGLKLCIQLFVDEFFEPVFIVTWIPLHNSHGHKVPN